MEFNLAEDGIMITQNKFSAQLLIMYGMDSATSLSTVSMGTPGEEDIPTPEVLRNVQGHVG